MRYVAYKHVTNQMDNNFQSSNTCNLHSWAGDISCCFTSDFSNNKCMSCMVIPEEGMRYQSGIV